MSRSNFAPCRPAAAVLVALLAAGCRGENPEPAPRSTGDDGADRSAAPAPDRTPVQGYEVVARYPHDRGAYTQGLLVVNGQLYESTGQRGESTVRLVDLETGAVERSRGLESHLFAEGLAAVGDLLYQLTWHAGTVYVWDRATLRPLGYTYAYEGEGWGLTTRDDGKLVMSDGTSTLRIVDPKGFRVVDTLEVHDRGQPVLDLNELEWIEGEIWANVWKSDRIARIDPETGAVRAWVDLTGILQPDRILHPGEEVLNGIAYDKGTKAIYVTGKRWPKLFQIRVVE